MGVESGRSVDDAAAADPDPAEVDPDGPDAQSRELLARLEAACGPPLHTLSPAQARADNAATTRWLVGPPPEVASIADRRIMGPGGPLTLRVYRAHQDGAPGPVLVWFHGGGWVVGDLETHDVLCRHLALAAGCTIVSVDYRLAPEHPFPAAVDDARAATDWVLDHAEELGADAARVVVGGDSAGGNLAAVVARHARAAHLAGQVLVYPVTDHSLDWPSVGRHGDVHHFTTQAMRWYWDRYVPDPEERDDPDASPLRAGDLTGVAPAVVLVAACDLLHDQGVAYAGRLREAGVRVRLLTAKGQLHGYLRWTAVTDASTVAIDAIGQRLRGLARST
ncbi:MAG: alpha/beta hydrolase [Euzebyales bacterium]|jgi:acetyl esterase|nr:alpha/beta hydrolase [Euzebyales bacterium]